MHGKARSRHLSRRIRRTVLSVVLGVTMLTGLESRVLAAPVWRPTGGPTGGYVDAIVVDPSRSDVLVASLLSRLYGSTDGGLTWTAQNSVPSDFYGPSLIVVDSPAPSAMYVGDFGSVARSTNGGATWRVLGQVGTPSSSTFALAVDRQNPAVLYAGTYLGVRYSGGSWVSVSGDVFKSTNAGLTWTAASSGITDPAGPFRAVRTIASDPHVPATVYAAIGFYDESALKSSAVFRSTNGGQDWSAASVGLPKIDVGELVVAADAPGTAYAVGNCSLFRSTNGGQSWAQSPLEQCVSTLALDPKTPSTAYAVAGGAVFRSIDSGASWSWISTAAAGGFRVLAVDPNVTSVLYAGGSEGIFKSTDGGQSWTKRSAGVFETNPRAVAADPGDPQTVYTAQDKSTDGGATWQRLPLYHHPLAIDPVTPSVLYGGGFNGAERSTDGGATWTTLASGDPVGVFSLAINPTNAAVVYAGGSGIFRTVDAGVSWSNVAGGLPLTERVWAFTINRQNPSTLYAGTYSAIPPTGRILKSTDAGASWSPTQSPATAVLGLATDLLDAAVVYAVTGKGLYKSEDGGQSFALKLALLSEDAGAVLVDPQNRSTVYAALGCTVVVSTDAGRSWNTFGQGLFGSGRAQPCAKDLTLSGQHTLYAGTQQQVFKLTECGDGVRDPAEECDDGNTLDGDGCDSNCSVTGCGNGIRVGGEACDGIDLGGQSCGSLGLSGSGLACTPQCTLDTAACGLSTEQKRCRGVIRKGFTELFQTQLSAFQRCIDTVNRGTATGPCPDAHASAKVVNAASKAATRIGLNCAGGALASLSLPSTCSPATSPAAVSACVIATTAASVDAALAAEYGQRDTILSSAAEERCQAAISSAGKRYTTSRLRIISRCLPQHDLYPSLPCPGNSERTTIERNATRIAPQIAGKCTDALVPVVRGPSCTTAATLAELAACQVAEHDGATNALITLPQ